MPTYRSINIALHSQFDVEVLPEYVPTRQPHHDGSRQVPKPIDDKTSTCNVYVPVLPGSLFWIGYSVSPPVPTGHYFLFKLYMNGAHIVSWSTGKEEEWRGKTMFGLYDRPEDEDGKKRLEKRVLGFTSVKGKDKWDDVKDVFDEKMCIEIKVHRAHGRKRIERQVQHYEQTEHGKKARVKGVELVNAGRASSEQPKRFYTFALIDPVDQPFATFRYFYRTWEQLECLGFLAEDAAEEEEEEKMPVIEPYDAEGGQRSLSATGNVSSASNPSGGDMFFDCADSDGEGEVSARPSVSEQPRAYVPRGAPSERASDETLKTNKQPPNPYRLSVPPSTKSAPSQPPTLTLPDSLQKPDAAPATAYSPHPAYPMAQWRTRTPSPVKSIRSGISTPPMGKSKASTLFGAFTMPWKRCNISSSRRANDGDKQGGGRSLSR